MAAIYGTRILIFSGLRSNMNEYNPSNRSDLTTRARMQTDGIPKNSF
jgi:hypothetical protein